MPNSYPFAQRTNWALNTNQLTLELKQLREQGRQVYDLTESNPTRCRLEYPAESMLGALSNGKNICYDAQSRGGLDARKAICHYYAQRGVDVQPGQIFLTASTSEAYSFLFRLLADPGDRVLFPRPSYPLFAFLGELNDVHMDTYPLVYNGSWAIDLNTLGESLEREAKALVLVNPNNPTGSFVQPQELDNINRLCKKYNSAVICDEVFADFAFDRQKKYATFAGNRDVLTFTLGGISKTLGLPQMKLSWIIVSGPGRLVDAAAERLDVIADTYLSVNTPVQNALPEWLMRGTEVQEEIQRRTRHNLDFLVDRVPATQGCFLLMPEGGWYAVVEIPRHCSEEEWALMFLREDQVAVHPGYFYDFDREAHIVLSLLPLEQTFQEGVQRILARINRINSMD